MIRNILYASFALSGILILNKGKLFCSYYDKGAKEGLQLALLTNNEEIKSDFVYLGQNMDIEEIRATLTPNAYESELAKSSNVIKDIFNNKVALPVIVSIEINHQ